jgi:ElaB/YqjD/DUF883 family membrane-anchored ribosome-binding protein
VQASIKAAKQEISAVEELAEGKVRAANNYVHEHPWTLIGAATAVGALIGMLIARR